MHWTMIPAAMVLLVIGGWVAWAIHERKRTDALRLAAQKMGFEFHPNGDTLLLSRLKRFHLFSTGRSRRMTNMLHGHAQGIELAIFDYKYTTGGGKNSHTWRQTVACFRSERLNLPDFSLRPEHVFHKIGGLLGFQDIDIDQYPDFSRSYLLKGSDEEAVRGVFGDPVLAFYERTTGLSTEGAGDCLIHYRSSRRIKPSEVMSFMEDGFGVFELFAATGGD